MSDDFTTQNQPVIKHSTVIFAYNGTEMRFEIFRDEGVPKVKSSINGDQLLSFDFPIPGPGPREMPLGLWAGDFFDASVDTWWGESDAPTEGHGDPGPLYQFISQARAGFIFGVTSFG